jgi:hypothetical protein
MEELSASLNRATAASVGGAAVLTWFFSAMQCNKEYCYTTDNPIVQVALAGTLAAATVMAATSAPVLKAIEPLTKPVTEKINHAKAYLDGVFASQKTEAAKEEAIPNTAENSNPEKAVTPIRSGSGLFSPKSDSVRANASEASHSPQPSRSPSPEHS